MGSGVVAVSGTECMTRRRARTPTVTQHKNAKSDKISTFAQ